MYRCRLGGARSSYAGAGCLVIALLIAAALVVGPASSEGRVAYQQHCASCHGADLRGGPSGPTLRGVGAADVDFWVGTGRMPAAVPWIQVSHRGVQFPQNTVDAIVAYVTSVAPGGPPIPAVVSNGDPQRGRTLFEENCMHCHGAAGHGASIGYENWAPSLDRATVIQVAEAVRVGPGEMPAFGEVQVGRTDLDDLVTYLSQQRAEQQTVGLPVASGGPVPEGLIGWLAAVSLALLAYAFSRSKKRLNDDTPAP